MDLRDGAQTHSPQVCSKCLLLGGLEKIQDMKVAYVGQRRSCAMHDGHWLLTVPSA